jgi:trk system potassium uptake protein TrkA
MKSILVIGLGRFGRHMAIKFAQLGNEVMVIDQDENKVNDVLPMITSAQIGDCTNEHVLRSLGIKNFDMCVVAIGSNFQASLEITSLLKELGATFVLSKANRDTHAKFLLRNGADAITYAEKEMAERLAVRYSANNVFEYVELTPEYSIFEIPPMEDWIGKTIEQKGIRTKHHISILATKVDGKICPIPKPDYMFTGKEHLIVIGRKEDVLKLR